MNKLAICILSLAILASCKSKPNTEGQEEQEEQKIIHDIEQYLEDLPNPSIIHATLKSIDTDFSEELVNPLEKFDSYKGDVDKLAVNMGIYAADAGYSASFGNAELAAEYIKTCHAIGIELGDSAIFKDDVINKIVSTIGNQDSLSRSLRRMIVETSVQLERDHHLSMAALALTGEFIEEMFQAVFVIDTYHSSGLSKDQSKEKVAPLVQLVLNQEQPLLDLIAVLQDLPKDDTINEIMLKLSILDDLYKGELADIEEKMSTDPDYVPDRRAMKAITLEIENIRDGIVN